MFFYHLLVYLERKKKGFLITQSPQETKFVILYLLGSVGGSKDGVALSPTN